MNPKVILVVSEGPMAASVVAGLVEQFGYLQLPFRNFNLLGLSVDSVKGKRDFLQALKKRSEFFSKPRNQGLRSAHDRSEYSTIVRVDHEKFMIDFQKLELRIQDLNFPELYDAARKAFGAALTYKTLPENIKGHVELITSINDDVSENRIKNFRRVFPDSKIIFMRRHFIDWAESLAPFRFNSTEQRLKYLFSDLVNRFGIYERSIQKGEGVLHVDFDQIFQPLTDDFLLTLCEFLADGSKTSNLDGRNLDLFGQMIPFQAATTAADFRGRYFSGFTLRLFDWLMPNEDAKKWSAKTPKWKSAVIFALYLAELCRYHCRDKTKI
jgi:hypothetical protein